MAKAKVKGKKSAQGGGSKQPQPLAVLYQLDEGTDRGDRARSVLQQLGIRVKTLTQQQLGSPVGAVAGIKGFRPSVKPYAGPVPQCEFMLLANVPPALLDQLLQAMRSADVSVACKAQVTQSNRLWPVNVLIGEVSREHEALSQ